MEKEITNENSVEIAEKIILELIGYDLLINSFYSDTRLLRRSPNIQDHVSVMGGYEFENGVMRIFLTKRVIRWDVFKEKVYVDFLGEGKIIILRYVSDRECIQRVIIRR